MKKYCLHTIIIVSLLLLVSSCSTQKNTWLSRKYNSTTARYNINFNGKESYEKGLRNLQNAYSENYTEIIPMYPISKHDIANAAASDMDRTIEKSRKAIKLRSIKKKPKRNLNKWNDPKYKAFYNQTEFNPMIKEAWLLLGQAEFHKGDFIGSIGTFNYIARHYAEDNDLVAQCQLWKARAYGELGWHYDAEQIIESVSKEELKYKTTGLLAAVSADVLLKQKRYKEAIPYLELALSREKDMYQKRRFTYLLAQLYHEVDDNKKSHEYYNSVIKKNPPYEMEFNARIAMAQLGQESEKELLKNLRKMIKNPKNKDYLDQLYYTVGNIHLNNKDTISAIENFILSTEKSSRNGVDKAMTLITLADLYYQLQKYVESQPAYEEAAQILSVEYDDYQRVYSRSLTLSELVTEYKIVTLQDSLLHLSTLPESEQLAAANRAIEKLIAEEKAAEEAALEAQFAYDDSPALQQIAGARGDNKWYFYNQSTVNSGKSEFQRRWGRRALEDNWRRSNKSASLFDDNLLYSETAESSSEENGVDSVDSENTEKTIDKKKPEYYLQQIPKTQEQKDLANSQLATSLYKMAVIYKDKIEDYPMAIKTFEEFIQRFGHDERIKDAYFNIFQVFYKSGNTTEAERYRRKLLAEFEDSRYAKILATADFERQMKKMYAEQDSIYNKTYKAYSENDFNTVFKNKEFVEKNYPLSTLMPKFMFLNALSIGKTQSPEQFESALASLVEQYPNSDVSSMSKDILALIRQGLTAQQGQTHGSLLSRRNEADQALFGEEENAVLEFSTNKTGRHRLILITAAETDELNKLLYQIASFNFSRFMIKDFDLEIHQLDKKETVLSIMGLESYEEVIWYKNMLFSDSTMHNLLDNMQAEEIAISEQNFKMLPLFSLEEYRAFLPQILSAKDIVQIPEKDKKTDTTPASGKKEMPSSSPELAQVTNEENKAKETSASEAEKEPTTQSPSDTETEKAVESAEEDFVEPKEEALPLFKGLFGYRENEAHFVALYIANGTPNFDKLKADFDAYNNENYGMLNLNISLESAGKQQVIIIGSFKDANIAKSYLLRMVKERHLFEGLKSTSYRNLIGSQKNLNTMIQNDALNIYFEFMQEYYLK